MRNLIFTLVLVFALPTYAMGGLNPIQQKLRDTPAMSERCTKHIAENTKQVKKYQERIDKYKAKNWKVSKVDKLKLNYFKAELKNWVDYCTKDNE